MPLATEKLIEQLTTVVDAYYATVSGSSDDNYFALREQDARRIATRAVAALARLAPPESPYLAQAQEIEAAGWHMGYKAEQLVAVVEALRDDYKAGALTAVRELVHADLFGDFLGMAEELRDKGFVGPAAALAGSVLEEHLRKLALKRGIQLMGTNGRAKSVEVLGVELRDEQEFSEVQRKSITAWYAQRTEGAHGRFENVSSGEVQRMIDGIRDFVARHPA